VVALSESIRSFNIISPYNDIADLISDQDKHYKTNLHTHSTYSDANFTMTEMIEGFYDNDFDILAFAEHGILGKEWDQEPTIVPLFLFQNLWHGKRSHPTTAQYKNIVNGSHITPKKLRTKDRGLQCVPDAIEANMFTLVKNHVNGYFTDDACEGIFGKENDYEIPIRKIEQSGGISHINHPTDWLQAYKDPDCAKVPENIEFFADLLRRYKSCLGIEVLNMYDRPNRSDRILWDELLKTLIPEGERCVWGFGNSDAHRVCEIDTAFMDFILPEYSLKTLRTAMEKGQFFALARYAKNELGEDFEGVGLLPRVTDIEIDQYNQIIRIKGIRASTIDWIADGEIIKTESVDDDKWAVLDLKAVSDSISCYVRFQLKGEGGILMSQPFICDDGDMSRFRKPIPEKKVLSEKEQRKKDFYDTRLGVIIDRMIINK
jgi:hypothetical protein